MADVAGRGWAMRTVAALASATLACAVLATAGTWPARAAATGQVTAVAVAPGPFAVDGVSYADAEISVTASDARGGIGDCDLATWGASRAHRLRVTFEHESGDLSQTVDVDLVAHTTNAGVETWTGTWRLGSTRDGYWMVSHVWWCVGTTSYSVDPRTSGIASSLEVRGTHLPTVAVTRVPAVAAYGAKQWARITYRWASGRPMRSYAVAYGSGTACGSVSEGSTQLTTDSHGQVTVRLRGTAIAPVLQCLYLVHPSGLPTPAAVTLSRTVLTRYESFKFVSISLSSSRITRRVAVMVTGSVWPAQRSVRLQVRIGHTWRDTWMGNVSTATGHYYIQVFPPYLAALLPTGTLLGAHDLRVAAIDSQGRLATTYSKTVRLTITS